MDYAFSATVVPSRANTHPVTTPSELPPVKQKNENHVRSRNIM